MEDKIRRRNLLAGEDELARFYQQRLPGIYDTRTLQKLIRDRGSDEFLRMREEDVLVRLPEEDELSLYPDEVILDGHRFTCDYRYEPGHPEDGVTMKVPLHMISTVPGSIRRLDYSRSYARKNYGPLEKSAQGVQEETSASLTNLRYHHGGNE